MTIDELIEKLVYIKKDYGNLDIKISCSDPKMCFSDIDASLVYVDNIRIVDSKGKVSKSYHVVVE